MRTLRGRRQKYGFQRSFTIPLPVILLTSHCLQTHATLTCDICQAACRAICVACYVNICVFACKHLAQQWFVTNVIHLLGSVCKSWTPVLWVKESDITHKFFNISPSITLQTKQTFCFVCSTAVTSAQAAALVEKDTAGIWSSSTKRLYKIDNPTLMLASRPSSRPTWNSIISTT